MASRTIDSRIGELEQQGPASSWLARQIAAGRLTPGLDSDQVSAIARLLANGNGNGHGATKRQLLEGHKNGGPRLT